MNKKSEEKLFEWMANEVHSDSGINDLVLGSRAEMDAIKIEYQKGMARFNDALEYFDKNQTAILKNPDLMIRVNERWRSMLKKLALVQWEYEHKQRSCPKHQYRDMSYKRDIKHYVCLVCHPDLKKKPTEKDYEKANEVKEVEPEKPKGKSGRPKGSKNKVKTEDNHV